jgi:Rrf2 family protein
VYPFGDGKRKTRPMKLELSSEGCYALRALVYLARDAGSGELVTADRISTEAVVPRSLLARVMAKLARAGLVETSEGRGGGSRLARQPEDVSLRDAVEGVEGPFEITHCIMQQRPCGEGAPAPCTTPGSRARTPSSNTSASGHSPTSPPRPRPSPGRARYPEACSNP